MGSRTVEREACVCLIGEPGANRLIEGGGSTAPLGDRLWIQPVAGGNLAGYLVDHAQRRRLVILTARILQVRRLVIGEVGRLPELAQTLYEAGPRRTIEVLAGVFERLAARGLLVIDDPLVAARIFNWLIMAEPLNRAMWLGDQAVPTRDALRRHTEEGVRVFLSAPGARDALRRQTSGRLSCPSPFILPDAVVARSNWRLPEFR